MHPEPRTDLNNLNSMQHNLRNSAKGVTTPTTSSPPSQSSSDLALYGEVPMESDMIFKSDTGKYAWDNVNNMELPTGEVQEARKEEMTHMKENTNKVVKRAEAFEKTRKPPMSSKSVTQTSRMVWAKWVARDFKTRGEKDREDLFCATPPLELLRLLLSPQATHWMDGNSAKRCLEM